MRSALAPRPRASRGSPRAPRSSIVLGDGSSRVSGRTLHPSLATPTRHRPPVRVDRRHYLRSSGCHARLTALPAHGAPAAWPLQPGGDRGDRGVRPA